MDACLMLAETGIFGMVVGIIEVALALGFVIFVHELGHFGVAKMCGVQCDKFFVGFDIGGYKLSRKWGETEYGIGILPLGGYVKMMGQDDDPSKFAEQMKESQAAAADFDDSKTKEITGPSGEKYRVDRRSYMAKSVWQRMLIISAGVVMNLIFGFIFVVIVYAVGREYQPTKIGSLLPGAPAYMAGLVPGDEIIEFDGREKPSIRRLSHMITLGDLERGVPCVVKRADGEVEKIEIQPDLEQQSTRIGIASYGTTKLHSKMPAFPGSVAEKIGFKGGDEVASLNGTAISDWSDIQRELVRNKDVPLEVTVRRVEEKASEGTAATPTEQTLTVPPTKMRRLGIKMKMGPVAAVRPGSPAEQAGFKAGDVITAINGRVIGAGAPGDSSWDPVTLPYVLGTEELKFSVLRNGELQEIAVTPEKVFWKESPQGLGAPLSLPGVGLCYHVEPEVVSLVEGSPAAKELRVGDVVTSLLVVLSDQRKKDKKLSEMDGPVKIGPEHRNWPHLTYLLQEAPLDSQVMLTYKRPGSAEPQEVTLDLMEADGVYLPDRGMFFAPLTETRKGKGVGEVLSLAADELWFQMTAIFRVMSKIGSDQVPTKSVSGPLGILVFAYKIASQGIIPLLLFLTMLSANLAVLNFLPIPVLDGGHMMFLAYEGIRGRPANEKVTVGLHMIGLFLLLSLMVFALSNDVRNLL